MLSNLNVDRFLADKPLAITASGLEELRVHILGRLALFDADPRAFVEMRAAERATPKSGRKAQGSVGIIQIRGAISQHPNTGESAGDFASTDDVSAALRAMADDPDIGSIVLDFDSPGGTIFGVPELAAQIREARARKPIVAVANSLMASAAYWLGAQADQLYVTPGGIVGSIGVYGMHQDISKAAENEGVKFTLISAGKHKVDGNPYEPLPDDVRERMQARIDEAYDMFIKDVARGRGVSEAEVRNGYGEGDIVTAKQAKALGMVDGIYTLEQAIARAATMRPAPSSGPAAAVLIDEDIHTDDVADSDNREAEQEAERTAGAQRLGRLRLLKLQDRAAAHCAVVEV